MAKPSRRTRSGRARRPSGWRSWLWLGSTRFTVGLVVGGVVVLGVLLWTASQGGDAEPVATGVPVEPFELRNVVSGQPFDIGAHLGREPVVVVSYMGFF